MTGPSPVTTQIVTLSVDAQDRVALQADCASGTVLAGSGATVDGLLESTDGGQSFSQVPITISGQAATLGITAVAIIPGQPTSMIAGGDGNLASGPYGQGWIVSSDNGGQTWTVENDPLTQQNFAGPGIRNLLAAPVVTTATAMSRRKNAHADPSAQRPGGGHGLRRWRRRIRRQAGDQQGLERHLDHFDHVEPADR